MGEPYSSIPSRLNSWSSWHRIQAAILGAKFGEGQSGGRKEGPRAQAGSDLARETPGPCARARDGAHTGVLGFCLNQQGLGLRPEV